MSWQFHGGVHNARWQRRRIETRQCRAISRPNRDSSAGSYRQNPSGQRHRSGLNARTLGSWAVLRRRNSVRRPQREQEDSRRCLSSLVSPPRLPANRETQRSANERLLHCQKDASPLPNGLCLKGGQPRSQPDPAVQDPTPWLGHVTSRCSSAMMSVTTCRLRTLIGKAPSLS